MNSIFENTATAFALKTDADFKAKILENQFQGLNLRIDEHEVWSKLIGTFNAYNLLAIFATSIELGIEEQEALRLLSNLESVSGRFQYIRESLSFQFKRDVGKEDRIVNRLYVYNCFLLCNIV